jgi:hypothetical protein
MGGKRVDGVVTDARTRLADSVTKKSDIFICFVLTKHHKMLESFRG